MSNNSWGLTVRLINKHFNALGGKIAEAIANFDPETATQADRDNLADLLEKSAGRLNAARVAYEKEAKDVTDLKSLIDSDSAATEALLTRLSAGQISEETVTLFCDELEANKARLPQEEQEAADAKAFLEEIQKLVDTFRTQLTEFDKHAKAAMTALANAQAQRELQEARRESVESLNGLRASAGAPSSALAALHRRAERLSNEAAGIKAVTDVTSKPAEDAKKLSDLRASLASGAAPAESAAERLRRLTGKAEA